MSGYNKPFPVVFCVFTFLVFLLPGAWLARVESVVLTPVKPLVGLFASGNSDPVPLVVDPAKKTRPLPDEDDAEYRARLEKELTALKADYLVLANENRELKKRLDNIADFLETQPSALKVSENYELIIADVIISEDATSWHRSLTLNRGSSSGITDDMPVIYGKYLVGKIVKCGAFDSHVQLLTDPVFRTKAFAMAPETATSANPPAGKDEAGKPATAKTTKPEPLSGSGVLEGRSTNECILKWISRDVPVKPDWLVLSASDMNGVYPRGLIIGRVTSVEQESYFYRLNVAPLVDAHSLGSVVVLKKKGK